MVDKSKRRKYIAAAGMVILAAVLLYFYFNDPAEKESTFVSCTFKNVTGWDCAGCGGQRSLHHLLHLDLGKAIRYNAFLILLTPYFLVLIFYAIKDFIYGTGYPKNFWFSGKMALIFVGLIFVYTFIRNLPYSPFTLLATPE